MLNFNPSAAVSRGSEIEGVPRIDEVGIKNNWKSLERHLDYSLNNIFIGATQFESAASGGLGFIGNFPIFILTNNATDVIACSIKTQSHWISGNIQFTFYYCGTVGDSTKNWKLRITGEISKSGFLLTTSPQFLQNFIVQAPASINTQVEFSPAVGSGTGNAMAIDSTSDLIAFQIIRLGTDVADTYTGSIYFIGILITYKPNYANAHF